MRRCAFLNIFDTFKQASEFHADSYKSSFALHSYKPTDSLAYFLLPFYLEVKHYSKKYNFNRDNFELHYLVDNEM